MSLECVKIKTTNLSIQCNCIRNLLWLHFVMVIDYKFETAVYVIATLCVIKKNSLIVIKYNMIMLNQKLGRLQIKVRNTYSNPRSISTLSIPRSIRTLFQGQYVLYSKVNTYSIPRSIHTLFQGQCVLYIKVNTYSIPRILTPTDDVMYSTVEPWFTVTSIVRSPR